MGALVDILSVLEQVNTANKRKLARNQGRKKGRADTSTVAVPMNVMISQLLPKDTSDYFYYQGGLTTPGCNEAVLWTNFKSTVKVSEAQLGQLRRMVDTAGVTLNDNFRPPQPLMSRNIYTTQATAATAAPAASAGMIDIFGAGLTALLVSAVVGILGPVVNPPPAASRTSYEEEYLRQGQQRWANQ